MAQTFALVLFTDIRGFTNWSEANEVFANLTAFVPQFLELVKGHFPGCLVKGLGDGAMIVREIEPDLDAAAVLRETLATMEQMDEGFRVLCRGFADRFGQETDLRLGWGVVRGAVKKIRNDYVGHNVNKAARLCDQARPWGVVIDRDDFPDVTATRRYTFYGQTRRLAGLTRDVNVWVTEEIGSQFITRERLRETPEVHVAGLCIDVSSRKGLLLLLAKRVERRRLFGGLIEGCGGQLARSESFAEGVARHFRLEMGIEVRVLTDIHCFYEIREPNEPLIPGIRFLCERVGDKDPRSVNHEWVRWVAEKDFRNMPANEFIPGLKDQWIELLDKYKGNRSRR
ncbi:MAG TPA: NUDIX domain-containing protein [Gemmataceae bacterium]|nr:NUDIX domain-containing protein [Gemmataceae bacterium]